MKFKLLLICLVVAGCSPKFTSIHFLKQDEVILAEDSLSTYDLKKLCNRFANYAPDTSYPDHTPMKYVRVNFHIINNSDSTSNFRHEEGVKYVKDLLNSCNRMLRNNRKMNLPLKNDTEVLPINYQFVLTPDPDVPGDDGIYFHYDDELCYMNKKDRSKNLYQSDQYKKYGIQKGIILNIFLMEHPTDSLSSDTYNSTTDGIGAGAWAKVIGCYDHKTKVYSYKDDGQPVYMEAWYMAKLTNHELGHCMGLAHTWNANDGCDDTPINNNCWGITSSPPCKDEWSNNMMDYNTFQDALTPCQIGKIRYNFSRIGSVQRKLLNEEWCYADVSRNMIVERGEQVEWPCNKDVFGDIIIEKNASLTLYCRLSMPPGGTIKVLPGAKLILNGSTLTSTCEDPWSGIMIYEKEEVKGEVIYLNNPKIQKAANLPVMVEE